MTSSLQIKFVLRLTGLDMRIVFDFYEDVAGILYNWLQSRAHMITLSEQHVLTSYHRAGNKQQVRA